MKIVYNFYILIIILTKTEWVILSERNFDDMELTYLSHKLNPIECLRVLEAMYIKRPMTDDEYVQSVTKISLEDESILRRQLEMPFFNRDNCRRKLQEWTRNLPQKSNKWARMAMESVLRTLGRPDLAKYVRRNRRVVKYLKEISRMSRKAAKRTSAIISKVIRATVSPKISKYYPREASIRLYRNEETKSPTGNSNLQVTAAHHAGGKKSVENDDTTTRWTAFLVLLAFVVLTIISTVVFALYKKNAGSLFSKTEKCTKDHCPRFSRKASNPEIDVENGGETEPMSSRCFGKRDRRSSKIQEEPSRSPSSSCVRQEISQLRKPKRKKSLRVKGQRASQIQRVEKRTRRRCDKRCTGMKNDVAQIEKSTKTRERKMSEKGNQIENCQKPRIDFTKFHEKITSILGRDNRPCKCCKCDPFSGIEGGLKCINKKKNICDDEVCQKKRLLSIAELCLSRDDTSPGEEPDSDLMKKKKKQKRKKKPKREKEKESSPENSARSKERESKRKNKKLARAKKEKYNVEEACTRKTCDFRKSITDDV